MVKGWECPKCGMVWSPWTTGCGKCNYRQAGTDKSIYLEPLVVKSAKGPAT